MWQANLMDHVVRKAVCSNRKTRRQECDVSVWLMLAGAWRRGGSSNHKVPAIAWMFFDEDHATNCMVPQQLRCEKQATWSSDSL